MPSRNLYECKQVVYCVVWLRSFLQSCCCLFICVSATFILHFIVACLLLNVIFSILMLLLYFCLFIDHVNKSIIIVFGVYHFTNTIYIFVIIIFVVVHRLGIFCNVFCTEPLQQLQYPVKEFWMLSRRICVCF